MTMESPVCTPTGSKFSIEQTAMALPSASRTTSNSISFQPATHRSTRICPMGEASMPPLAISLSASRSGGDAAAGAAQRERGPHDDRVADGLGKIKRRGHVGHHLGGDAGLADLLHGLLKQQPVLGLVDGVQPRAQKPHAFLFQKALPGQLHRKRQAVLAAHGGQKPVRLFLADDALEHLDGQRFNVDVVGDGRVGHDGGGIGVDQNDGEPQRLQRAAGPGSRRSRTRRPARSQSGRSRSASRASDQLRAAWAYASIFAMKLVEQEGGVQRAAAGLRVELHGEGVDRVELEALAGQVRWRFSTDMRAPAFGQRVRYDRVSRGSGW